MAQDNSNALDAIRTDARRAFHKVEVKCDAIYDTYMPALAMIQSRVNH